MIIRYSTQEIERGMIFLIATLFSMAVTLLVLLYSANTNTVIGAEYETLSYRDVLRGEVIIR